MDYLILFDSTVGPSDMGIIDEFIVYDGEEVSGGLKCQNFYSIDGMVLHTSGALFVHRYIVEKHELRESIGAVL